jgi:hypothetical protein
VFPALICTAEIRLGEDRNLATCGSSFDRELLPIYLAATIMG